MFSNEKGFHLVFFGVHGADPMGQLVWCAGWVGQNHIVANDAAEALKNFGKVRAIVSMSWSLDGGFLLQKLWGAEDNPADFVSEDHHSYPSLLACAYESLGEIAGIMNYNTARGWMDDAANLGLIPADWGRRDRDFPPTAAASVGTAAGPAPESPR